MGRRNSALSHVLRQVLFFFCGKRGMGTQCGRQNLRQGAKAGMDVKVLTARCSLNWRYSPRFLPLCPVLFQRHAERFQFGAKLLYLGSSLGHARRGCSPPSPRGALQALSAMPTSTTAVKMKKRRNIYRRGRRHTCSTTSSRAPPASHHSGRRFRRP